MLEIAPALEGAERPRLHQHQLAVHHEAAAPDAILVGEWPDRQQPLAAEDLPPDHPVERASLDEFVGALRHHAGGVDVLRLLTFLLLLLEALLDPVVQFLDRVDADAEFEQMQGHGAASSMAWGRRRSSDIVFRS